MSVKIETAATVTTIKEHSGELTAENIRDLLRAAGHEVPDEIRIYFHIPGGGHWSNTDIDIDQMHPIRFSWSTSATTDI